MVEIELDELACRQPECEVRRRAPSGHASENVRQAGGSVVIDCNGESASVWRIRRANHQRPVLIDGDWLIRKHECPNVWIILWHKLQHAECAPLIGLRVLDGYFHEMRERTNDQISATPGRGT